MLSPHMDPRGEDMVTHISRKYGLPPGAFQQRVRYLVERGAFLARGVR
jgi:hypothetical protein